MLPLRTLLALLPLAGALLLTSTAAAVGIPSPPNPPPDPPLGPNEVALFDIAGEDAEIRLRFQTLASGEIEFEVEVVSPIGDLRSIYFDIADDSILSDLYVVGADVTAFDFSGSVNYLGPHTRFPGDTCPCDFGIAFGTEGIDIDDIQTTTFVLGSNGAPLLQELFSNQTVAIRMNDVDTGSDRSGYSKLVGNFGDVQPIPEPATAALLMSGLLGLAWNARRCD